MEIPAAPSAHARPRNVVIIIGDDHQHDCLGAAGHPVVQTPYLDSLIRGGTRFSRAQIAGGDNPAVCVPSRAALHTGCFPSRAVAPDLLPLAPGRGTHISPRLPLLGEAMRHAGYDTFITGKWHNCFASLNRSFASGARIYTKGMGSHTAVTASDYDPTGEYPLQAMRIEEGFSSELFADAAINFLTHRNKPDPFFLYLAFTSPHDPRTPPAAFRRLYDEKEISLPNNFLPAHPFDNGEMQIRDERLAAWPRRPEEIRRHLADYYGMISHQDAQIGRIVETLRHQGLLESTIIVYLSDHGLALGQHGLMGKQNLYEHSLRVPLILHGPGVPVGRQVETPVYSFDLMPTLCDLCRITLPPGIDGKSLVSCLLESPACDSIRRDTLFAYYRDVQRMVHDGRLKLIEYRVNGKRRRQLFDLSSDPHEMQDLISDESSASHLPRLFSALATWEDRLGLSSAPQ